MNNDLKKLLIIIPALNEEKTIHDVIVGIPKNIDGIDYIKCLVINDGSTDKTAVIAKNYGATVISSNKTNGVGSSVATGLDYALKNKYTFAVSIDADNQFNSQDIAKIITPITMNGFDFVTGNRFHDGHPKNMSKVKYYGNIAMSRLISIIIGEKFQDVSCGFRGYNKEAILNFNIFGKYTYTQEMFLNFKFKNLSMKEVPIDVRYFKTRKSRVVSSIFKYTWKTLNIIIRSFVYYKPLRFFGYPGIFFLTLGSLPILFLLHYKITTGSYTPYKIYGFIGGSFFVFGTILILFGFLADILDKIKQNQEKILYYEKKKIYERR